MVKHTHHITSFSLLPRWDSTLDLVNDINLIILFFQHLEDEIDRLIAVETEMEHAKCEVETLKKLLDGKDRLVIKQAQQIANATGNRKSMESIN